MKLYKSGLALKREGTDETVAAFINEQDLDNVLEAVMTKKKPNKPVPGDESNERMAIPRIAFFQNVFHGDPPLPHASWNDWMADVAQSHVIRCVTISQASISDYSNGAGMPSAHDDISAQLREYASNPGYSHNDYAYTMRQAADAIDAGLDAIRVWSAPAPVQQAAPSELWKAANDYLQCVNETSEIEFSSAAAHTKYDRVRFALQKALAPAAVPAQPVGLSEQDKLDAARLDFMDQMSFTGAWPSRGQFQVVCHNQILDRVIINGKNVRETIDAAILAAKEAP